MGFTVAIVGRPNVGKSTFFNRLLEQRKAIVEDTPGVTRDRQYGIADWTGKSFNVIDTGGFVSGSDDMFEREIRKQVMIAVEEANAIVFMVDASTGITDLDESMADVMRRTDKPVLLAVNKVDNHSRFLEAHGRAGDVLVAISTSGNSGNVLRACETARKNGMDVIALSGKDGGKLAELASLEIRAPHSEFADRAQEIHIKVIHALIEGVEKVVFA
jgi:small GTP-binding protein